MTYPELDSLTFTDEQAKGITFMCTDANTRASTNLTEGQFLCTQLLGAADSFARDYRQSLKTQIKQAIAEAGETLTLAQLEQKLAEAKLRKKDEPAPDVLSVKP